MVKPVIIFAVLTVSMAGCSTLSHRTPASLEQPSSDRQGRLKGEQICDFHRALVIVKTPKDVEPYLLSYDKHEPVSIGDTSNRYFIDKLAMASICGRSVIAINEEITDWAILKTAVAQKIEDLNIIPTSCGHSGTPAQRIKDCHFSVKLDDVTWSLVSEEISADNQGPTPQLRNVNEVWYDNSTKRLWADTQKMASSPTEAKNICEGVEFLQSGGYGIDSKWTLGDAATYLKADSEGLDEILFQKPNSWTSTPRDSVFFYRYSSGQIEQGNIGSASGVICTAQL